MKKQKLITTTTAKREKPPKLEMSFEEATQRIVRVPPLPRNRINSRVAVLYLG